jgi:hypothetical protein
MRHNAQWQISWQGDSTGELAVNSVFNPVLYCLNQAIVVVFYNSKEGLFPEPETVPLNRLDYDNRRHMPPEGP